MTTSLNRWVLNGKTNMDHHQILLFSIILNIQLLNPPNGKHVNLKLPMHLMANKYTKVNQHPNKILNVQYLLIFLYNIVHVH